MAYLTTKRFIRFAFSALRFRTSPDKFYKGRSQEKTPLLRLEFFLLLSPLNGAGSVLTARTRCSVTGRSGPAIWGSSPSGFHRMFATKPVSFRNQQSRTSVTSGDHSSIRDSWPIAFYGYPRGPSVACETRCRSTQRLTAHLRLALEPECLENPTAAAGEDPPVWSGLDRDTQTVCGFR